MLYSFASAFGQIGKVTKFYLKFFSLKNLSTNSSTCSSLLDIVLEVVTDDDALCTELRMLWMLVEEVVSGVRSPLNKAYALIRDIWDTVADPPLSGRNHLLFHFMFSLCLYQRQYRLFSLYTILLVSHRISLNATDFWTSFLNY